MEYKDIPKLFVDNEIYILKDYDKSIELEMKKYGDYLNTDLVNKDDKMKLNNIDLSIKNIIISGNNFGRILLHEWFYFYSPQYFEYYAETINKLQMEDEFLPINWRFYISIMVSIYTYYLKRFIFIILKYLLIGSFYNEM